MDEPSARVLLADDHQLVAQGVAGLLETRYQVIGVVDSAQALREAAASENPDVILTDISMPGLDGLEITRQLRRTMPETPVIMLTMHDDVGHAKAAFEAGAAGYLVKSSAPLELFEAIEQVLAGRRYLSSAIASKMMDTWLNTEGVEEAKLSEREREVAGLVGQGLENPEIAEQLCIAKVTVRSHLLRIQRKLGLKNRVAIARYAISQGWASL